MGANKCMTEITKLPGEKKWNYISISYSYKALTLYMKWYDIM